MSIASILGFLAATVIARPSKEDRVAELERENARLKEDLAFAQEAMSRWRNHALAATALDLLESPRNCLLESPRNCLMNPFAPQPMQASQKTQHAMMQNAYVLGMQNLGDAVMFCNCVPSRAQVWAADRAEA